jgi:hypothetical protein
VVGVRAPAVCHRIVRVACTRGRSRKGAGAASAAPSRPPGEV